MRCHEDGCAMDAAPICGTHCTDHCFKRHKFPHYIGSANSADVDSYRAMQLELAQTLEQRDKWKAEAHRLDALVKSYQIAREISAKREPKAKPKKRKAKR